jgi:DNA-directed RNA polymerase subunit alpha
MKAIPLPDKIKINEIDSGSGQIIIEPCFKGYGITLGNALRRVLLSSLTGAAIHAIKIKGVQHEFSTLANIKEDIVDIILNFKLINVKMAEEIDEIVVHINHKGLGKITGKDIVCPTGVEIVNPELLIATSTDKDNVFQADLFVSKGKGYWSVESRPKDQIKEIGVINIDAIYSPVRKVNYKIDNVRVGEDISFEQVVMDIETNKTLTPREATYKAVTLLIEHFRAISDFIEGKKVTKEIDDEDLVMPTIPEMASIISDEVFPEVIGKKDEVIEDDEEIIEDEEEAPKKRGRAKKSEITDEKVEKKERKPRAKKSAK